MSTYNQTVAANICADDNCGPIPSTIEGALTCTPIGDPRQGGWPRAGGTLQFQLWSDPCPAQPNPSQNICFRNPINVTFCAKAPGPGQSYNPNKWHSKPSIFYSIYSYDNTRNTYRANAELTVISQNQISVTLKIDVLKPVGATNQWVSYITTTKTLDIVGAFTKTGTLNYALNPTYQGITSSIAGVQCEVTYVSMNVTIIPMLDAGCGRLSQGDLCRFYNGTDMYSCFRGIAYDKNDVTYPKPFIFGFNPIPIITFAYCDQCNLLSTSPVSATCNLNTDPTFLSDYVYTGYEPVGIQQIQLSYQSQPYEVMVKSINNQLYFIWRNTNLTTTWSYSAGTIVQAYSPTIYEVQDADTIIYLYTTRFPSEPNLLPDCNNIINPVTMTLEEKRAALRLNNCGCGPRKG